MALVSKVASATLAAFLFLLGCQNDSRPQPLEQDPFIQVYFNQNFAQNADYTEPYRTIERPGDNLEQVIVDAIASSTTRIDVAVQELRLPKVAQALAERHSAGVEVRVILENEYNQPWSRLKPGHDRYLEALAFIDLNADSQLSPEEINQRDALIILQNAGIPILDDTADGSKGSGLMHHKFIVIDGQTVLTGSTNLTPSGTHGDILNPESRGNANNLLKINSPELANLFTQEFNQMWGDGVGGAWDSKFGLQKTSRPPQQVFVGDSVVTVQFSPISPTQPWTLSSNGLIGNALKSATESINLALFVFSEQKLADILESEQSQGVTINALIDPSFAFRDYSEGLDMLGVALSNNCRYEADNRPWSVPITNVGVPNLPQGDKLHHKFGVIDNRTTITGSHNWSAAANNNNDETVLVIQNPTVAKHFTREFERLNTGAILGIPVGVQQKIESQQQQCPTLSTASSTPTNNGIVNLNTASQSELESLPGIGEKIAQKIIETRQEQPFTSLEDLERVPGIGSSLTQKLEGSVTW